MEREVLQSHGKLNRTYKETFPILRSQRESYQSVLRKDSTGRAAVSTTSREGLIIYPKVDSRSRDEYDGSFTGLLRFKTSGIFSNVTIEQGLETLKAWR